MEEKMRQQQTIVQAQEAEAKLNASKHGGIGLGGSKHGMNSSKHGGSRHGLGGNKHGRGGGLMSHLGGGLKNQQQQQQVAAVPVPEDKEKVEAPSTPTALAAAPNQNNDMEILKKMNSRVKALSQSRVQLAAHVKAAERDKNRLMHLVKNEILDEGVIMEASDRGYNLGGGGVQEQARRCEGN